MKKNKVIAKATLNKSLTKMDDNTDRGLTNVELSKPILICMISSAAYSMYSRKKNHDLMVILLRDIKKALEEKK